MALLYLDNYENWDVFPGTFTSTTQSDLATIQNDEYYGGKATSAAGAAAFARITLGAKTELIVNLNVNVTLPAGTPTDNPVLIGFWDGSNQVATLHYIVNGLLELRQTPSGTLIATSSLPLVTGVQYDIELRITFGVGGSADLTINGSSVDGFSVVADTNLAPDSLTLGTFQIGTEGIARYNHVIIMDSTGAELNAPIGPVEVNSHTVTANGNYTDWTPNGAATLAECVDDPTPNGDTDYASSSVVGNKMSFVCSDLPPGVTTVFGVGVWQNASRDDALSRGFKSLLWNGAGDQLSTDENFVSTGYGYYLNEFPVNPFTGVAWTPAEVDSMEYGAELTT